MQKVYLMLRNNQQTGPYTLEEILQLNLKPFDLVWMEGRSAAWRYPGEIDSLKPFVPQAPKPVDPHEPITTAAMEQKIAELSATNIPKIEIPKKVFVSLPGKTPQVPSQIYAEPVSEEIKQIIPDTIQQRAETLHQRFQPNTEQKTAEEKTVQTNYTRSVNEVEEDYTKWMYNQKTKKKKPSFGKKDLAVAALIVAVIIGGYYLMSKPSIIQPQPNNQIAKEIPVQQQPDQTPNEEKVTAINLETSLPEQVSASAKTIDKKKTATKQSLISKPVMAVVPKLIIVTEKQNDIPANQSVKSDVAIKEETKSQPKNEEDRVG